MSLFSDALSDGFGAIEDVGGELVTYTHADGTVVNNVVAVPGKTEGQEISPGGKVLVTTRSSDWQIRTGQLSKEPSRGDKLVTADGRTYTAVPSVGGPVWVYSDTSETFYRIHFVKSKP